MRGKIGDLKLIFIYSEAYLNSNCDITSEHKFKYKYIQFKNI